MYNNNDNDNDNNNDNTKVIRKPCKVKNELINQGWFKD